MHSNTLTNKPTNQPDCLVSLDSVALSLTDNTIFTDLSLTFGKGEKVALLGDSGVGKSSLLKLIAGIHQPTAGKISNQALRIGYVFQEPRLLPWLTVGQNIIEVMKANHMVKEQLEQKLTELLTQVELLQCKHYYPHQLSGGMAQRVSLARAFAIEPDLLLLDEPFSALDKNLTEQLSQLLSHFLKPEITMLYVSHYVEQVLPLTQSCLFLHNRQSSQKSLEISKQINLQNIEENSKRMSEKSMSENKSLKNFTWYSTAIESEREHFLNQYHQQGFSTKSTQVNLNRTNLTKTNKVN